LYEEGSKVRERAARVKIFWNKRRHRKEGISGNKEV
jgi:hypothetical protein